MGRRDEYGIRRRKMLYKPTIYKIKVKGFLIFFLLDAKVDECILLEYYTFMSDKGTNHKAFIELFN